MHIMPNHSIINNTLLSKVPSSFPEMQKLKNRHSSSVGVISLVQTQGALGVAKPICSKIHI